MSTVKTRTLEILDQIAQIQEAYGDGVAADLAAVLGLQDLDPASIKAALERTALNDDVRQLVDRTVGDAMTVGDETSVLAAFERAVQGCFMARTRRLAHHVGRARGHANPQGILRYGLPEMISRPG